MIWSFILIKQIEQPQSKSKGEQVLNILAFKKHSKSTEWTVSIEAGNRTTNFFGCVYFCEINDETITTSSLHKGNSLDFISIKIIEILMHFENFQ